MNARFEQRRKRRIARALLNHAELCKHAVKHVTEGDRMNAASEREEVVKAIAAISERMKGPLDNVERAWSHADRKDLRDRLAAIDAEAVANP